MSSNHRKIKFIFLLISFCIFDNFAIAQQAVTFEILIEDINLGVTKTYTVTDCSLNNSDTFTVTANGTSNPATINWRTFSWTPVSLSTGQSYQFEFCISPSQLSSTPTSSFFPGDTFNLSAPDALVTAYDLGGNVTRFVVTGTTQPGPWNNSGFTIMNKNGNQFQGDIQVGMRITSTLGINALSMNDINKSIGDSPFTLTPPTTASTGVISYTSSNSSVATISGNTVTIHGIGNAIITATQAADTNYSSASTSANLIVGLNSNNINALDITKIVGDPPFILVNPSSASSGVFSYSSSNSNVATISGNTVTIHDTGSSVITVTQAAAGSYLSATTTFTLTVTENPNDPEVAFETIKNEITNLSESTAVSSSLEQVKNAEFVMREKMVFHGEMMRSTPTIATSSFIDYDINVDADSHQFFGDGHYHQTDIVGDEFRQRLMIDGKIIHSKNNSKTHVFSALALYDFGILKDTSQQYRIGFKRSIGDGKHPISFKSKSASGRIGTSLSHSFSDKIYGGVYADLIYSETKSAFFGDVATVNSKINTLSTTGGAQISGQEQVNSNFWINPSLSISYNKDHLMKKRFVSKTVLGSSVVNSPVSMATVLRVTAEPEMLLESKADSKGSQNFMSLNPSYACESMKTGKKVSTCNTGIFFQIGKKNNEKNITGKFSFSYEKLNGGVKHEYGLKLKADF